MLSSKYWNETTGNGRGNIPEFINVILLGSTGVGKSAFINTCATALASSGDHCNVTMELRENAGSGTKKVNTFFYLRF